MELVVVAEADRAHPTRVEEGFERDARGLERQEQPKPMDVARVERAIGATNDPRAGSQLVHPVAVHPETEGELVARHTGR
jgi:hypothetical protein